MLDDTMLWPAIVMTAGTVLAIALRPLRIPAVTAALLAGLFLAGGTPAAGRLAEPAAGAIQCVLAAFLGVVAGSRLELGRLGRLGPSLVLRTVAQSLLVFLLAGAALLLAGASLPTAMMIGSAAIATSSLALGAVAAETGSRGDLTQRILALSAVSLPLAVLVPCLLLARFADLARLGWIVPAGIVGGVALLLPVSRMSSRGPILAAAGGGVLLLIALAAQVAPRSGPGPGIPLRCLLIPMSILAGFIATNFIADPDRARDALRGFALPAIVALFVLDGMAAGGSDWAADLGIALLVIAARAGALLLGSLLGKEPGASVRTALAQLPMAGLIAVVPVMDGLARSGDPSPGHVERVLLLAGFLSTALGAVAARWALAASGEASGMSENPDDWRARMRLG